ncbi:MAG: helix-turn-helix transcriptional regulator, partial [Spirochaetales bacterium]|nr:helix-turn-helix transcriptional regulator [Spirochaetales bacterium]
GFEVSEEVPHLNGVAVDCRGSKAHGKAFSRNLRKLRKKRGLTQYDLADMTGISRRRDFRSRGRNRSHSI